MLYSQEQKQRINGYLKTINYEVHNTNLRAKEIKNILVNGSIPMDLINDLTSNDIENNKINQDREFFQKTYALFKGNSGEVSMLRKKLEAENLIVFYLTHLPRILTLVKLIRYPTNQNIYLITKRLYLQELKDLQIPTEKKMNNNWNKIKTLIYNIADTLDNYKRDLTDRDDLNQIQLRINKIHTVFEFIASVNDKEKYINKVFKLTSQQLIQELVGITQIRPSDRWFEYLQMLDYVLLSTVTKDSLLDLLNEQDTNDDYEYDDTSDTASVSSWAILDDLDKILTMDLSTPPLTPSLTPPLSPPLSPLPYKPQSPYQPQSPTEDEKYDFYKLFELDRPSTPVFRDFNPRAKDMERELYEDFSNTVEQALPYLYDKMKGYTSIYGRDIDECIDIITKDLVHSHGPAFDQLLNVNNLQLLLKPITMEE
jgi:hypothetical protein